MAQWSLADRTLYAKLVYYGPALGGKTTNLRVLHALTDPEGRGRLVSVSTADDRTLFFDLLPLDLGSLLGYKVALKLYTVPGQVRYDATRKAVLAGADAIVFVADSDASRESDNRWSFTNLKDNMRASRLDPAAVPILVQLNKRDLPHAAPLRVVETWLDLPQGSAVPAVACGGQGVLETFVAACHRMIERIVAQAEPRTRRTVGVGELKAKLDATFAPYFARSCDTGPLARESRPAPSPIVLSDSDLVESGAAASVALGAQLADERSRALRLEREAESLRRLSDMVRATGASFERERVLDATLGAAVATLGASGAALCVLDRRGHVQVEQTAGRDLRPLAADPGVATHLARMLSSRGVVVVNDARAELASSGDATEGLRALVLVPVECLRHASLLLATPASGGIVSDSDVRFLATLAGHLAIGLEKVRVYDELRSHRDRLEHLVEARTQSLRKAYEELQSVDAMKDRFLANVSHEIRSPLTAIIGAATFLNDYDGGAAERREMAAGILRSTEALERRVEDLLRVARLAAGAPTELQQLAASEVVAAAVREAGAALRTTVEIDPRIGAIPADPPRLIRALANLVENAVKFGPAGATVEIRVTPCRLSRPGGAARGVSFAVLDRGPGIPDSDVERAFSPFEQGGHPLTGKPSGIGLGLYEARAIARRHGGRLDYLPRPGGGSQLRLSLPAEAAVLASLGEARHA